MSIDIEFRGVSKSYGNVNAVNSIDLVIESGSFLALLGPSGCGKTTCLRMIGGFEQPTSGEVLIRGQSMAGVPAYNRPINMVFQHYALFPHMDVARNVAYGLRQSRPRLTKAEINLRVDEALKMVRLSGYGKRRIFELSGGQQQRVALARALVNKPSVLLLDEPLAALDKKLRIEMQMELQNLQRELGITFVLVTHDQEEALSMSDIVCVMNGGRIVQLGSPKQVYDEPADLFVADFVGKTNMLNAVIESVDGETAQVRLLNGTTISATIIQPQCPLLTKGASVNITIRPEAMRLSRIEAQTTLLNNTLIGKVTNRIFLGSAAEYAIQVTGVGNLLTTSNHQSRSSIALIETGEQVSINFSPEAVLIFSTTPTTPLGKPAIQKGVCDESVRQQA